MSPIAALGMWTAMMLGIGCVGLYWARRERKALEAKKPQ
jgi:hypothetical protein